MLLRSQAIFQISFEKVLQSRHPDHNFCSIYPELKIPTVYFWHTASRPSRLYIQPAECRPHFHQYVKYWILKNQLGTHTVGPQPKEWNGRESELNFSSSGSQKSVEISWNSARFDISWNVLRLRNTIVIRTRKVGDKIKTTRGVPPPGEGRSGRIYLFLHFLPIALSLPGPVLTRS